MWMPATPTYTVPSLMSMVRSSSTSTTEIMSQHWAQVKDLVSEGVEAGYVHPDDVSHLVPPEPKPGRFYGLVKNHVEPDQWKGQIQPLRPIVSGSGCNTEGISHFVDEYAKGEVKKLDSWLEDTRHILQVVMQLVCI
jgi:hypothetical protein